MSSLQDDELTPKKKDLRNSQRLVVNNQEIEEIRHLVDLSLQDNEETPRFNTFNSVNVPVNKDLAFEMSRFRKTKKTYKKPEKEEAKEKKEKKRPENKSSENKYFQTLDQNQLNSTRKHSLGTNQVTHI